MKKEGDVTESEYLALASMRYTLRRFLAFSERAAAAEGLMPQQHQALLAIRAFGGKEGLSIRDLAERLQVKHHSAVGLIDRLVRQDAVERRPSSEDRRVVYIVLTTEGKRLLARLTAAHRAELKRIGPELSALFSRLSEHGV